MISVTAVLRLGRDAEIKNVGSQSVLKFNGASTEKRKDGERTTWIHCDMWGARGEKLVGYLTKGSQVCVSGTLSTREYQGKDGTMKMSIEMRVNELEFVGGKRETNGTSKPTEAVESMFGGGDDADIPF